MQGAWDQQVVLADQLGADEDAVYLTANQDGASDSFAFNGQKVEITYSVGPEMGIWAVEMDGEAYLDEDTGDPVTLDGYNPTVRYGVRKTLQAEEPGEHLLGPGQHRRAQRRKAGTTHDRGRKSRCYLLFARGTWP